MNTERLDAPSSLERLQGMADASPWGGHGYDTRLVSPWSGEPPAFVIPFGWECLDIEGADACVASLRRAFKMLVVPDGIVALRLDWWESEAHKGTLGSRFHSGHGQLVAVTEAPVPGTTAKGVARETADSLAMLMERELHLAGGQRARCRTTDEPSEAR